MEKMVFGGTEDMSVRQRHGAENANFSRKNKVG
jgi:hypothetical protein